VNPLDHPWMLAAALLLDALVGDPDRLWKRLPHPVAIIGAGIGLIDRWFNREGFSREWRRALGVLAIALIVVVSAAIGLALQLWLLGGPLGWIGVVLIAAVFLSGRSLYDHVASVDFAFDDDLEAARRAVARIVGRDPGGLDEARVCRAAIESAAENFSDGVVAPAFWFLLLGLPGIITYKAINTADSMIGHLTSRHEEFGWAAARLDDLVNWPASRIAGSLIALAAPLGRGSIAKSFRLMRAEAGKHRSPNAGWPEAAMASAIDVALAGPRRYAGVIVNDPFINATGRRDAMPTDIGRALKVYLGAWALLFLIVSVPAEIIAALLA
jgi:adenosylcobinamide-phosphate synthase